MLWHNHNGYSWENKWFTKYNNKMDHKELLNTEKEREKENGYLNSEGSGNLVG